jgi:uncharacterized protein
MKLDNEFTVGVPVEQAWTVLTDLELIAPCMPGAQLTGVNDGVYSGRVKIKVGPVTAEYAGTATFSEKDDTAYRAVIDARGRDSRGQGNANAVISAQLRADGGSTVVTVSTDLTIAGRIAQFGSGMIKEVSAKLLGQFVDCLEQKLGSAAPSESADAGAAPQAEVTAAPGADGGAAPRREDQPAGAGSSAAATADQAAATADPASPSSAAPSAAPPAATSASPPAEPAPLDLMRVAGGSVIKRVLPLVVVVLVVVVAIILLVVVH